MLTRITAQSQAGINRPKNIPTKQPRTLFLGINLTIVSSFTYTSIKEDKNDYKSKNGKLSKKIEKKTIQTFFISLSNPL